MTRRRAVLALAVLGLLPMVPARAATHDVIPQVPFVPPATGCAGCIPDATVIAGLTCGLRGTRTVFAGGGYTLNGTLSAGPFAVVLDGQRVSSSIQCTIQRAEDFLTGTPLQHWSTSMNTTTMTSSLNTPFSASFSAGQQAYLCTSAYWPSAPGGPLTPRYQHDYNPNRSGIQCAATTGVNVPDLADIIQ